MTNLQRPRRFVEVVFPLVCVVAMAACQVGLATAGKQQSAAQDTTETPPSDHGLVIENDSDLPLAYPLGSYELRFRAHGSVSVLHWRVEKGTLPPGMNLDDTGLLRGRSGRTGGVQFTVSVTDGGNKQSAGQKG